MNLRLNKQFNYDPVYKLKASLGGVRTNFVYFSCETKTFWTFSSQFIWLLFYKMLSFSHNLVVLALIIGYFYRKCPQLHRQYYGWLLLLVALANYHWIIWKIIMFLPNWHQRRGLQSKGYMNEGFKSSCFKTAGIHVELDCAHSGCVFIWWNWCRFYKLKPFKNPCATGEI